MSLNPTTTPTLQNDAFLGKINIKTNFHLAGHSFNQLEEQKLVFSTQ